MCGPMRSFGCTHSNRRDSCILSPLQVSKAGDLELTVQACTQLSGLEGVLAQWLGWSEPLQATQFIVAFLGPRGLGFLAAQSERDF